MATPFYLAESQFTGRIRIDFGNYADFNDFAADIEQEYMQKLLGYRIYKTIADYENGMALGLDDKYGVLIEGDRDGWTDDDGVLRRLSGLKEMLKWFFYVHYLTEDHDARTVSGDPQEVYIKTVNGARHVFNQKIVKAWNRAVDLYYEIVDYMEYIESGTPDTYEDWDYEELEYINNFGI